MAFESIPDLSIGADVIVGFSGEGEEEFERTYSVIKDLPVSYLHIFPYSKRRGTAAEAYPAQPRPGVVKKRCERLRALDEEKRLAFYGRFAGRAAQVLVESARDKKSGLLKGRARNYIPVLFEGGDALKNTVARVRLDSFTPVGMRGTLEEEGGT
jgi:threonylcarbamoyladenosine tRNA methylthiotransferase MtaB